MDPNPIEFWFFEKTNNPILIPNPVSKLRPNSCLDFTNLNWSLQFQPSKLVDREIDWHVTIALRFMFIFILFFYLPMVSVFFLLCSGSTRCTAFLGSCRCLLSCQGFCLWFSQSKNSPLFGRVSELFFFLVLKPDFFFFFPCPTKVHQHLELLN
jgi:hypothetical protein